MAQDELDAKGVWTVPGERTKNHRPLVLPLPRQARAAIDAWPRVEGRNQLFGRTLQKKGEKEVRERGYQGWSRAKSRLDTLITLARAQRRLGRKLTKDEEPKKEDALPSWDLHDLRRTVETRTSGLRIPKDHVNKVLTMAGGWSRSGSSTSPIPIRRGCGSSRGHRRGGQHHRPHPVIHPADLSIIDGTP